MTRFTGALVQILIVPVALAAVVFTAYLGLNGINNHDWRFLFAAALTMSAFFGLVKLFTYVEAAKRD